MLFRDSDSHTAENGKRRVVAFDRLKRERQLLGRIAEIRAEIRRVAHVKIQIGGAELLHGLRQAFVQTAERQLECARQLLHDIGTAGVDQALLAVKVAVDGVVTHAALRCQPPERKIFEAVLRDQRDRFLQQLAFQISMMILIGHFLTSLFVVMGLL